MRNLELVMEHVLNEEGICKPLRQWAQEIRKRSPIPFNDRQVAFVFRILKNKGRLEVTRKKNPIRYSFCRVS